MTKNKTKQNKKTKKQKNKTKQNKKNKTKKQTNKQKTECLHTIRKKRKLKAF